MAVIDSVLHTVNIIQIQCGLEACWVLAFEALEFKP
jgi:hypothetical protein